MGDELVITFDHGVPVAIDGETVTALQAIQQICRRASEHVLDAVAEVSQEHVSGEVRMVLHGGRAVMTAPRPEKRYEHV
jgi:argininosuccinate synthase